MATRNSRTVAISQSAAAPKSNKAGAVGKTLDVLERIILGDPAPSAAQISRMLEQPRPTTNRIIANLIRLGFVKRDPVLSQLAAGDRLQRLALSVVAAAAQQGPRHQILQELAADTEETCNVGVVVGGRVRYLDRVEAKWPLALRLEPGSEIPLYCTALGKLLLGLMPEVQREKHLRTMTLRRYTANTITDRDALRSELAVIAEEHVAFDREEYLAGVIGMAVPIAVPKGTPQLAIAVAAPSARLSINALRKDLPALHQASRKLAICYADD